MPTSTKQGGVWKTVDEIHVKDSGTWKEVQNAFIKDGGVWKETHAVTQGGGSIDLATLDIFWKYQADQSSWTTMAGTEPGDTGNTYFISSPNLNSSHAGSANGNEFYSNKGVSGPAELKGYVINDAEKGIQLTSAGEESIKVRLYDGSSELGLRHDTGEFFEAILVKFVDGYGPGNNFRKDNGWWSSKWEGGNQWKIEDIYAANNDGTGATFNGNITPEFGVSPANGETWLMIIARDMDGTRPSVNATVPSTVANGPKNMIWLQQVTAGATWDPYMNDTLNESIVDSGSYDFSPAYVHSSAPDIDKADNNTHEYFVNEQSIVKLFAYDRSFPTQAIFDALLAEAKTLI